MGRNPLKPHEKLEMPKDNLGLASLIEGG